MASIPRSPDPLHKSIHSVSSWVQSLHALHTSAQELAICEAGNRAKILASTASGTLSQQFADLVGPIPYPNKKKTQTQTHTGRINPKRGTESEEEMVSLEMEKEEEGDIEKEEPLI